MKSIDFGDAESPKQIELAETVATGRSGTSSPVKPGKVVDAMAPTEPTESKYATGDILNEDQINAVYVFRWLLVFNACLEAYGHGANDTANATGPFTAVLHTWRSGIHECGSLETPWYVMGMAGIFVLIGIVTYGQNVIETIGTKVAHIDFHKGFYIELGSNVSVIVATIMELPVSTTHCQIGGVLFVGLASAGVKKGVDWNLLGLIVLTWVMTLPLAGFIGGAVTGIVKSSL